MMPVFLRRALTVSVGCAPLPIHFFASSASMFTVAGSVNGLNVPISSMNLPSLGYHESATTTL